MNLEFLVEDQFKAICAAEEVVEEEPAKATKKSGPPKFWKEFVDQKYQSGKKDVPNPNQKTRKTNPTVTFNTAVKDKGFRAQVMKEYADWIKKRDDKDEGSKKPEAEKEVEAPKKSNHPLDITDDSISSLAEKLSSEFKKILGTPEENDQDIQEYEEDYVKNKCGNNSCGPSKENWLKNQFSRLSREEKLWATNLGSCSKKSSHRKLRRLTKLI
jgi:hypothetical protein